MTKPHYLLLGAPSAGKTLHARQIATDIPALALDHTYRDRQHMLRCSGLPDASARVLAAPFRAPHHTVSLSGMLGAFEAGWRYRPGELGLSHGGVLLLDEVHEFSRAVVASVESCLRLGVLRYSSRLEGDEYALIRVPAGFTLVAAAAECSCGFHGEVSITRLCRCTPEQRARHLARLEWLKPWCRVVRVTRDAAGKSETTEGAWPTV